MFVPATVRGSGMLADRRAGMCRGLAETLAGILRRTCGSASPMREAYMAIPAGQAYDAARPSAWEPAAKPQRIRLKPMSDSFVSVERTATARPFVFRLNRKYRMVTSFPSMPASPNRQMAFVSVSVLPAALENSLNRGKCDSDRQAVSGRKISTFFDSLLNSIPTR